jgi:WD40 repeat protein
LLTSFVNQVSPKFLLVVLVLSYSGLSLLAQEPSTNSEPVAPELILQTGQSAPVRSIAFSPDGKLLASGGFGEMAIHIWELSTGRQLRLLTGHVGGIGTFSSGVTALEFSPDSRLLAAGYSDSSMGIWNAVTGEEVLATPGGGNKIMAAMGVSGFAFSADGRLLASGDGEATKIWDLSTGLQKQEVQRAVTERFFMSDFALTRDGRELITLSRQTTGGQVTRNVPAQMKTNTVVHFTDVETGQESSSVVLAGEIPQTVSTGRRVATTPDGRILFLTVSGASVNIGDVTSKTEPRILNYRVGEGAGAFMDSQFLSANGRLAAFTHGYHLSVWDVERQSELYGFDVEKSTVYDRGMPASIVLSSDSKWLAVGNYDGSIRILNALSGRESSRLVGSVNPVRSLSFSASGGVLFSGAKTKWNLGSGRGEPVLADANGSIGLLSPNGTLLAEPSQSGAAVKIWDIGHRVSMTTLTLASESLPNLMAFSPDEKFLAVTYRQSAAQAERLATNRERPGAVSRPTFDKKKFNEAMRKNKKNGMAAVMAEYNKEIAEAQNSGQAPQAPEVYDQIKIWNVTSGQQAQSLSMRSANPYGTTESIAFSPDGKFLATALGGVIQIWDVGTGHELGNISPGNSGTPSPTMGTTYRSMGSLCYSPDGKYLAVAEKITTTNMQEQLAKMADSMRSGNLPAGLTVPKRSRFGGIIPGVRSSSSGKVDAQTMASIRASMPSVADMAYQVSGPIEIWDITSRQRVISLPGHENGTTIVSYSSDGTRLATSGPENDIKIWDLTTGKEISTLSGHTAMIDALAFSPRGDLLASASTDGMTRLWDVRSGEFLATLMSLYDGRDWLVVTPGGLFDGSPPAWNQILWRFDNNTFDVAPVESFFNEYYYPDLLSDILGGKRPRARQDLEKKDRRQPHITLAVPTSQAGALITAREIQVTVQIESAPAGAQDLRLFRNGSLVKFWHGDVLGGKQNATLETTIPIVAGANRLTAYAFNGDNIKSVDANLDVAGAPSLARRPVAYIVAVGINEYSNPDYNLRFAAADADGFSAELSRQLEKQQRFARIDITSLNDRNATKSSILAALKDLASRAQPEDEVFAFVASHGTAAQERFYLIPNDLGYDGSRTQLDEQAVATILAHSISDQELEKAFEILDVARLLLVIDACNSGQALEAEEMRRGPMNSKGLAQLAYEKGMYVLTASQSFQAAQEVSRIGHGLLTYALIVEGLEKGLADFEPKDGQVFVREWFDYASLRVPQVQVEELKQARNAGRSLSFGGEARGVTAGSDSAQHPKLFYRREIEINAWVIANPE